MTDSADEDYWAVLGKKTSQTEHQSTHDIDRHESDIVLQVLAKMKAPLWIIADEAGINGLAERLEPSGLEHYCLFASKGFEDTTGAAPWLIAINQQNPLSRQMLAKDPVTHWSIWSSGIILSSSIPGKHLAQHLRRLVLRRTEQDARVFHRFWEPTAIFDYFNALQHLPERAQTVFASEHGVIEKILAWDVKHDRTICVSYCTNSTRAFVPFQPVLDPIESAALLAAVLRPFAIEMSKQLTETDLEIVGHLTKFELEDNLTDSCVRLHGYGFRNTVQMRELALQDIWQGGAFENEDNQLREICVSGLVENDKYAALTQRIACLV